MSWSNIKIFENTRKMYLENSKLNQSICESAEGQKVITEEAELPQAQARFSEKTCVTVSMKRTFEAAQAYVDGKTKVCVLNFASATNPGGGVVRGASAQEECLCRCSTLYGCLTCSEPWEKFYYPHREKNNPLYDDDCIYTPDVVVFKSDTQKPCALPEKEWYKVNVITCAAPNLRNIPSNVMNPCAGEQAADITVEQLYDIHYKRLKRILNIAALQENDVIILGAFGCGAFMNNPEIVSIAMDEAVQEYAHMFRKIEFAVYCPPYDDENYQVFRKNISQQ